jgi:hypothetical protein
LPTISPPATGPRIGTSTAGRLTVAISLPSGRPPAACTSSVVSTGTSSPPPMPWTTRNAINEPMFQAAPAATDAARKTPSAVSQVARPPNRASAQPLSGITIA